MLFLHPGPWPPAFLPHARSQLTEHLDTAVGFFIHQKDVPTSSGLTDLPDFAPVRSLSFPSFLPPAVAQCCGGNAVSHAAQL